jgi:lipoprotein-releasing system ATP-binding protein
VLTAAQVSKRYDSRGGLSILEDVSFSIDRGQAAVVMGPSGSGKSTLLYILGALEPPTSGTVTLDGTNPYELDERAQARFRSRHVGFVFQDHLLLPQLSALDNVLVPTLVATDEATAEEMTTRARQLLVDVGLGDRLDHRPAELSGGEKQRVAIARALVGRPSVLLCDEPTGNLDRASASAVADLILAMHQQHRTMLVTVTHSMALAERFPVRYDLAGHELRQVS